MQFTFLLERTIQATAHVLAKSATASMDYRRLLALLHLANREYLVLHNDMIVRDETVMTPFGPVPERTMKLMTGGEDEYSATWNNSFALDNGLVKLLCDPQNGNLSPAICSKLDEIYERYAYVSDKELMKQMRVLPECKSKGPSEVISGQTLLIVQGHEEDIRGVEKFIELIKYSDELLGI